MTTVIINKKYAEALSPLGRLEDVTNTALRRYAVSEVADKIADLQDRRARYEKKYGVNFAEFTRLVVEDNQFVARVEQEVEKMWEADLLEWEFSVRGVEDWSKTLHHILNE